MTTESAAIQDVSDTALWVAYYRSLEAESPTPLFKDPLAKVLMGERGQKIAQNMSEASAHTRYNVVLRTVVIDRYIQKLVAEGCDCVVNLGAGLDTRPYRLNLPANLKWIEIDYPHVMQMKNEKLVGEKSNCQLERVSLDLSERSARKELLARIGSGSKKIVALTEGVLPYLTQEQASTLAEDLLAEVNFRYWIADYLSPEVYKYLKNSKRTEKMKNAPMQFFPEDWFGFFRSRGWEPKVIEYLPEEGHKLGREYPAPWIIRLISRFFSAEMKRQFLQNSGYMIMERQR